MKKAQELKVQEQKPQVQKVQELVRLQSSHHSNLSLYFPGVVSQIIMSYSLSSIADQINQLFSADKKMVIYPGTNTINMKRGSSSAIGIGIKNRLAGNVGANPTFDYSVSVNDEQIRNNCGIDANTAQSWIQGGDAKNIPMPSGEDTQVEKVLFNVPSTAPLCSIKVYAEVKVNNANYATDSFFMNIQ